MQDEECVRTVANAIQDLSGIGQINVSLEKGEAHIEYGRLISPEDRLRSIIDAGFEAS